MYEDKKGQNLIDENKPHEQIPRKLRAFIFFILISFSILINGSIAILLFCNNQIKRDLQLDDKGYRIFVILLEIGEIFGCIVFIGLLLTDRKKLLTLVCIFINILCIIFLEEVRISLLIMREDRSM